MSSYQELHTESQEVGVGLDCSMFISNEVDVFINEVDVVKLCKNVHHREMLKSHHLRSPQLTFFSYFVSRSPQLT